MSLRNAALAAILFVGMACAVSARELEAHHGYHGSGHSKCEKKCDWVRDCKKVPYQDCKYEPKQVCEKKHRDDCKDVPKEVCKYEPKKVCEKKKECENKRKCEDKKVCKDKKVCENVKERVCDGKKVKKCHTVRYEKKCSKNQYTYEYECKKVPVTECKYEENCYDKWVPKCSYVPDCKYEQECKYVPECRYVPDCHVTQEKKCETKYEKECHPVAYDHCYKKNEKVCATRYTEKCTKVWKCETCGHYHG